jgi:putative lipoic acid-binding regulatory protein
MQLMQRFKEEIDLHDLTKRDISKGNHRSAQVKLRYRSCSSCSVTLQLMQLMQRFKEEIDLHDLTLA